jgi:lipid A disaccharide synthetase
MNKIDTIEELLYEQEKLDQALNSLEAELNESDLGRRLAKLQSDRDLVKNKVSDAIKSEADKMLDHKPYACGTVNLEAGPYKVKTVVSKKVDWDQVELARLYERIRESGQLPTNYLTIKYSVHETQYKNFPDAVREQFLPARTVKRGAPKITIERK